ncbi:glycine betaine ABC transporter substrate-binding protein [Xylophilus ampelinus]|uniref:glycine betaine ABC transporter substrate-binding protein n=1 Tax=Xylophilus ampelinus TaxID=54067 RepID=UPI000D7C3F6F
MTVALLLAGFGVQAAETLRIGSKRFTESYILAEIVAQQAAATGAATRVSQGLGNTAIVYAALRGGSIDVYPEYTGTIAQEILRRPGATGLAALRTVLAPLGLGVAVPLGFNDGYALAMRADAAERRGIRTLADLARHPDLRLGLSNEFLGRADGWPGLARHHALPQTPQALDHGLAYDALARGQVDIVDIYTTDAQIERRGLRVLQDADSYFPRYDAVLLYRLDVPQRFPAAWAALQRLQGRIDEAQMVRMNARAEVDGQPFEAIAQAWHRQAGAPAAGSASASVSSADAEADADADATAPPAGAATADAAPPAAIRGFAAKLWGPDLWRLTRQHLLLVAASIGLALLAGVPLAMAVAYRPRLRALMLGAAGLLQTVPSLALLAMLISLTGSIGSVPALAALMLYALLPIMRNTATGLAAVPTGPRQAALALGMTPGQRMLAVELPLALPTLMAGVRTATAIAIGTATIAAFIGAGGYGERIVTGLALNDRGLLLAGALPAAILALASEAVFECLERVLRRRQAAAAQGR